VSLRSELALSHLKVLLAFVLIHLLLFIAANQLSGRNQRSEKAQLQALQSTVETARNFPELLAVAQSFAQKEKLIVEVEGAGGEHVFGDRRPGGPPPAREVVWRGDDQDALLRLRRYGGPPANPIMHVLLTALLAGFFGVFLAFRFSKAVSDPLRDLLEATEQLEAGQDEGTTLLAHTKGPQEIEDLAKSFARMSDTLSANMKQLKEERDRAEASEASRRQLIADVSHNLRTPMAAAIGWLDSLIDGHVEDPEPCLRQVRRETLWASQRLERLLHLSRWEHSEPMMTLSTTSLSDIVLEVAENLEERALENNLALELDIEPGLKVRADRYHLRDLIQILLENVIEHSGKDGHATVQARREEDAVQVIVKDDGPGLDPDFLKSWAGGPIVAKTGRVSLGLAIARRLAMAHGSELCLSNRDDQPGFVASFRLRTKDGHLL
jgi:signal transduction histidine kinase